MGSCNKRSKNQSISSNLRHKNVFFLKHKESKTTLNKIGTEYDVSHTGFLIKKDGELYIRHASLTYKKVVDEKFSDYIKKLQKNPKYLGFSILEIILKRELFLSKIALNDCKSSLHLTKDRPR